MRWWRVALVVLGVTALSILFAHRADAATGTDVCGPLPAGQTTWNAIGSPYRVCADGVEVPANGTLVLDGSIGSVQVQAQGSGGILVDGAIATRATSPAAAIVLDGPGNPGSGFWDGIHTESLSSGGPSMVTFDLSYVDIAHSLGIAGLADRMKLDHVTVHDGGGGISAVATTTSITNSVVSQTPYDGIRSDCPTYISPSTTPSTTVESDAVMGAGRAGISASACGPYGTLVLRHNRVSDSGHGDDPPYAPAFAISISANGSTVGPGLDIDDNQGAGNLRDVLDMNGTVSGGFTWSTPTNSSTQHPLGYATTSLFVNGPGTVVFPARSVVKGDVIVNGGDVDASAPGSVFTSPLDNTVGLALCPATCGQPGPGTAPGAGVTVLGPGAVARFVQSTVRFADKGFAAFDSQAGGTPSTLDVVDSTISDSVTGIAVDGGVQLSVSGGSISRTTYDGIGSGIQGGGGGNVTQAAVSNVSLSDIGQSSLGLGIDLVARDGGQISVTGTSVARAANNGITVVGHAGARLIVQNNQVTESGTLRQPQRPLRPWPAITVSGDFSLGANGDVANNSGSGNGLDAVDLNGTIENSFTWITPTNSATDHPLGYLAETLSLAPESVLTVPNQAVLKFHPSLDDTITPSLTVAGGSIDASAGGSMWTSWDDESVGVATCLDYPDEDPAYACPRTFRWNGIVLDADAKTGAKANARLVGATIRHAGVSFQSGASTTFGDTTHGFAVDASTFDAAGVIIGSATARIDGSRIGGSPGYGVSVANGVGATLACDTITNNSGGIAVGGSTYPPSGRSLSVSQTNLHGNRRPPQVAYDLAVGEQSSTSGPVIANSEWWGQPGGPTPGQIDNPDRVDASAPLDQPSSCAPPSGVPSAPMTVTATAGDSSAVVRWTAPDSSGAGPITSYTVTSSPGGKTATVDAPSTQATVSGLGDGTAYTFTVHATNDFGDSGESTPSNSVTPEQQSPQPPHSDGGFVLDDWGGIHPYRTGSAAPPAINVPGPYWPGQDVVRGIASLSGGGYVVDDWGGIHTYTTAGGGVNANTHGGPYWPGQDVVRGIAVLPDGTGGYVLDDWGGLHPFGIGASLGPPAAQGGPYWVGQDAARGVTILPDGSGGYVVDSWGGLHPFVIPGSGHHLPAQPTGGPYWVGQNVVRGVAADAEGNGGYVVDDWGGIHPFSIPGTTGSVPAPSGGPYWPGLDAVRGISVVP